MVWYCLRHAILYFYVLILILDYSLVCLILIDAVSYEIFLLHVISLTKVLNLAGSIGYYPTMLGYAHASSSFVKYDSAMSNKVLLKNINYFYLNVIFSCNITDYLFLL